MRPREIKWLIAIVFIGVLSGIMIKSWQYWQRNHFQCSGEMRLINAGYQGDISLRYVFDSNRGLAMVRGEITPPQGAAFTINQNIWFSFTRALLPAFGNRLSQHRRDRAGGACKAYPASVFPPAAGAVLP